MTRIRAAAAALGLAGALVAGGAFAGAAEADHTPRLTSSVVDETGSTGPRARAAVDELLRERDVQLYVVFVDSTGGASGPAYAAAVASENGLGGNDAVLVVAPDERRYGLWVSGSLRTSGVESAVSRRVEAELRTGDWDGAVAAAADALGDAAGGGASGARPAVSRGTSALLLVLLVAGLGGYLLLRRGRARRAERAEAEDRAQRREQVAGEAAAALIRVDERMRDAEAEVRLAGLTSDDPDAATLYEKLAAAREHVRVAFELRAREEDAPGEELLRKVLAECAAADADLDAVTECTATLRDLQANAPEMLAALRARLASVAATADAADGELARLTEQVPETSITVSGNVAEARKRLDYAASEVSAGEAAVAAKDMPRAALRARLAEQSVARAEQLVTAVTHLRETVAEARAALPGALREAERAVAAARDVAPARDERVSRAETALGQARDERDVVVAVRLAGEAASLVEPVTGAAAERRGAVETTLAAARAAYTTAADFVSARREGVGERPRARLLLAERALARAESMRGSDPDAALDAAREAERLAWEAYELAADDFDRLDRYDRPYGGGFFGGVGMPLPIPIPILIGGGGGWGGAWGGGWDGGWDGGGGDVGGGDSFGGTF